ncbi:MAG: hypothetical protein EBZ13_06180 [Planctomycetia bacterium]|jgi:predicted RNA-binding Zn-ribbon protein involved in translation (DUF1610 family)|nr:hypothetical protein [Planctomycetia bacterium]
MQNDADDWDDDTIDTDLADDGELVTLPCPYCGEEMLEDSPQCPACGNYISAEELPYYRQPLWVVVTAVICLMLVLGWLLRGW